MHLPLRRAGSAPGPDAVELLSAAGTFLAAVAAVISVSSIVLDETAKMQGTALAINFGWFIGTTLQIAAGIVARTRKDTSTTSWRGRDQSGLTAWRKRRKLILGPGPTTPCTGRLGSAIESYREEKRMTTKDPVNWMLSEAIDSLARAERLRQQFFSLQSKAGSREASWGTPDRRAGDRPRVHHSGCPARRRSRAGRGRDRKRNPCRPALETGCCRLNCAMRGFTGSSSRKAGSNAASRCLRGATLSAVSPSMDASGCGCRNPREVGHGRQRRPRFSLALRHSPDRCGADPQ